MPFGPKPKPPFVGDIYHINGYPNNVTITSVDYKRRIVTMKLPGNKYPITYTLQYFRQIATKVHS